MSAPTFYLWGFNAAGRVASSVIWSPRAEDTPRDAARFLWSRGCDLAHAGFAVSCGHSTPEKLTAFLAS